MINMEFPNSKVQPVTHIGSYAMVDPVAKSAKATHPAQLTWQLENLTLSCLFELHGRNLQCRRSPTT